VRRDRLGTLIMKGTFSLGLAKEKKHRVTFVDNIEGTPIARIHVVESFKKYNNSAG
jgi:hypothetical protein